MEKKTVLVTGIGGNVGQGIVRNINDLNLGINVIGCDVSTFTPGNHLCNKTYKVPYSYEENYIKKVQEIVVKEKIDLIIPSTDYEVYYLTKNATHLSSLVIASDAETSYTYLDKYRTYLYLSKNNIPFSKSWTPLEYDFSESNIIAKPREGRGSRGLIINPENPADLPDGYMIQPLYVGKEITTSVYVNKRSKFHGLFTMERSLTHGTTTECKVVNQYNKDLEIIARNMIALGGLKGSFNIQSIVDNQGCITPFEINCRISGTNSIRHKLGFQDVKYTIQEYLYNLEPDKPRPINGIATRILLDVVYPYSTDFNELNNKSSDHIIY